MATHKLPLKIATWQHEIAADFLSIIDRHLADIVDGRVLDMDEIRDIADEMNIHPTHLSNAKAVSGRYFAESVKKKNELLTI